MYQLPILPYNFQDFEPYIDTHTMGLHYHKHQQTYLNNLNKLLQKNNYSYNYTEEELINHINVFHKTDQEDIHFNLGGVINHNLYWKSIHPTIHQKPTSNLKRQIEKQYTTYENLLSLLKENALKVKGSDYTFLIIGNNNTLKIFNTKNQESPYLWLHPYSSN